MSESTRVRRKFAHDRDEMNYLYDKLLYWFYDRQSPRNAKRFADRLARLLERTSAHDGEIFAEECRSLICELKGDLNGAIRHRENEVRLIKRLHELARGAPFEESLLKKYSHRDLSDRLDLLAVLYHDHGELKKAIKTLKESRQFCERHGITFDGEDLLREYVEVA